MKSWTYTPKSSQNLRTWFSGKKSDAKSKGTYKVDFMDPDDFIDWYESKDKVCYYCGLAEQTSQQICHEGLLTSNRFPIGKAFKRGINRAYYLEIDRREPKGDYSSDNCVLACYWCNNDKSDVFSETQYKEFLKDRNGYLIGLLKNE